MFYVYLLRSESRPEETYIGFTANLKARLEQHSSGKAGHTSKFAPWRLVTYIAFSLKRKAEAFETYLKSGSGRAFANKHLCDAIR